MRVAAGPRIYDTASVWLVFVPEPCERIPGENSLALKRVTRKKDGDFLNSQYKKKPLLSCL
jgi:hypothetical protein